MNLIDARIEGDRAVLADGSVPLGAHYGPLSGRTRIGVRPEYVTLTDGPGLPVSIRRVEDVGRHRIVRADLFGAPLDVIVDEGERLPAADPRVVFAPDKINVYVDDWRVAGETA